MTKLTHGLAMISLRSNLSLRSSQLGFKTLRILLFSRKHGRKLLSSTTLSVKAKNQSLSGNPLLRTRRKLSRMILRRTKLLIRMLVIKTVMAMTLDKLSLLLKVMVCD
jgi:hypothetical protein